MLRYWRVRLRLALLEWLYGRVSLSGDFIFHPRQPGVRDPLNQYWTLGWKFSLIKCGRPYEQYGNFVKGTNLVVSPDPLLECLYGEELTQALNVAYELGREDSNIFLRLWRKWRRKSIRKAKLREGVPTEELEL